MMARITAIQPLLIGRLASINTDKKEDKSLAMIHYCNGGAWIDGNSGSCSAGFTRKEHKILLSSPKPEARDD